MKTIHTSVAETMQRTIETILLGDWRTIGKDQLLQGVAHIRSVKAHYVSTHMAQGLEIQKAMLAPLDQALTTLNLLLDTLEGRDMKLQQAIYDALQNAQVPLLAAYALVPHDDVEEIPDTDLPEESVPDGAAIQQEESDLREQAPSFRWTQEREQVLIDTLQELAEKPGTMKAKITLIAQRYGWPLRAVEYKVYALQRKQQTSREGQEPESSKEDDRSALPGGNTASSDE